MKRDDQFIYYNNLGNDYFFQENYQDARDCFRKAADLVKGDEAKLWDYYTALGNLGEIYICLHQADSARQLVEQADSFFHRVNFPPLIYYMATSRMELKMLEGDMQGALAIASASPKDDISIPAAKVLRLKALEQLMRKTGRWQEAMSVHEELHGLNDSIHAAQSAMRMSAQLYQYKHDKERMKQQQEIDHQQLRAQLALALSAVAMLAVVVVIVLNELRRRKHRLQEMATRQQIISLRMENVRNRITPHFIYNALNHEMLEQMEGRAVDLNALTQLLRRGVDQADMLETTLEEELRFVDYYVEIEGRQMADKLQYRKEIAPDVDTSKVNLPAMTIQIFVENAIKHGLKRQGGMLTIRASRQDNATLVEVLDNGQGLDTTYTVGEFMSSVCDSFIAFLDAMGGNSAARRYFEKTFGPNVGYWIDRTKEDILSIKGRYEQDLTELDDAIGQYEDDERRQLAIANQIRKVKSENLLSYLSEQQFIPNASMPTGVVTFDFMDQQQAEKLHMSAGAGLHVIMNQNFNINFEFGKCFDKNDGAGLGINIGLNYIF